VIKFRTHNSLLSRKPYTRDNIIIPEDLTVAASDNEEIISNVADQEESVEEVKGITDDWTHSENLENSTEVSNSSTAEVLPACKKT
jgi:hypothetical protein